MFARQLNETAFSRDSYSRKKEGGRKVCAPAKHFFDIQRAHTVRPLYIALMRFLIKVKRHDLPDVSNACKYKKTASLTLTVFGRGRRIRTLGTRFWRPLLYQLSYAPMKNTHDAIFALWVLYWSC